MDCKLEFRIAVRLPTVLWGQRISSITNGEWNHDRTCLDICHSLPFDFFSCDLICAACAACLWFNFILLPSLHAASLPSIFNLQDNIARS